MMTKSGTRSSHKSGLAPGSLIHIGDIHHPDTQLTLIDYSEDHCEQRSLLSIDDALKYRDQDSITWVTIEGLADASIVESIGEHFNIHPLVLEDILNTHQRPKLEEHEDYLYIVLKSLAPDNDQFNIAYEQVSLIVLKNFVFAFKEKTDSLFSLVATRIENSHGRVRSLGSDYLMYSLLDTIVDQNFGILDQLDETLAALEDDIFTDPTPKMLEKIHQIKLEVIKMRRYISPVRDLSANLLRSESELIKPSTQIYLRDVHDHVMRIIESIETHRDILSSLLDIYLSSVSSKLNEVMKILTIFSAIFIPLTFVAGIYGMNFKHMPELAWKWGYPSVWVVFIIIATSLYFFFKRKGWV